MKSPLKLFFLCLCLVLFIQSSCRKEKMFSYGPYKFAAKINGQDFVPSGNALVKPIDISFMRASDPSKTNLYLWAYNYNIKSTISIFIKEIRGAGYYPLNTYTIGYPNVTGAPHHGTYEKEESTGRINLWITNMVDTGYVNVSEYNLDKNIVKGTFYFKAKSLVDGTVVEVTKGSFSKN